MVKSGSLPAQSVVDAADSPIHGEPASVHLDDAVETMVLGRAGIACDQLRAGREEVACQGHPGGGGEIVFVLSLIHI